MIYKVKVVLYFTMNERIVPNIAQPRKPISLYKVFDKEIRRNDNYIPV